MKSLRLLNLAILALTICMASCSGEDGRDGIGVDGTDGTNGTDGTSGMDGTNGENGTDGENGVGFDETTKYGAVIMELDGTRPDKEAFTETVSFNFLLAGEMSGLDIQEVNSITELSDATYDIYIRRYFGSPTVGTPYAEWYIQVWDLGMNSQYIYVADLSINGYTVVGDDNKYFNLSTEIIFDSQEILDFTFDTTTNNLTFSYTTEGTYPFQTPQNGNEHELNVSGTVDVILFELAIEPEL